MKLKASQGVCNDTMVALQEEYKPCLKQTCMKFYTPAWLAVSLSYLWTSSPIYFWIKGGCMDSLMEKTGSWHVPWTSCRTASAGHPALWTRLSTTDSSPMSCRILPLHTLQVIPGEASFLQSQVLHNPEQNVFSGILTLELPQHVSALLWHDTPGSTGPGCQLS